MFRHIKILTLRASFIAQKSGRLPLYIGSTLRGVLGHCMRDYVCTEGQKFCHLCEKRADCTYAQCFCSPGNEAGAVNPFVLHALVQGKQAWEQGDPCVFDLTLIGKITDHANLFIDAFQDMGARGWGAGRLPFALEQIMIPDSGLLIYGAGKAWLRNLRAYPLQSEQRPARAALVRFNTPVRVLVGKKLCGELSFDTMVRSLARRLALLSQAYTDNLVQWDEQSMLQAARGIKMVHCHWNTVDFERYSMRQEGSKLSLPAIEGWALYEGDITPFTPLLEAGRKLHVGKNSTIGFGNYQVAYDR